MAIARGAGTEIIRTAHFESIDNTPTELIYGVRHHIYTILSIIIMAPGGGNPSWCRCYITGYDSFAGTGGETINIFQQDIKIGETFVWNDKFSMNGYEPVDFGAGIDSEAKQDAIADQLVSGDSNRQILKLEGEASGDHFDTTITYIDQNNA